MMEHSKRPMSDEVPQNILEPILTRVDDKDRIQIDKNEFSIGRARDNDEIILNIAISRRHCVFRRESCNEWTIKDLSSSATFVNDVAILPGVARKLSPGDIIQFSPDKTFRYIFTFIEKEHYVKRPRIEEEILDSVLIRPQTCVKSEEYQRKELKDKLGIKQKEQVASTQQLKSLSQETNATVENDKENLKQIAILESKIEETSVQKQHAVYFHLLEKLEKERLQFETKINEERQKWQKALDTSKQEREMLEITIKERMEKWREEQQVEWRSTIQNKVKEEKNIQERLLSEKNMLEERLKETEKILKEQKAKAEISQATLNATIAAKPTANSTDSCVLVKTVNVNFQRSSKLRILDTIDLTRLSENTDSTNCENETVLEKVSGIMDEQLTCSICSELFVNATTLNCTHTFCCYCINMWNKKQQQCPICRESVTSMNQSLVLDNFIESMIENLPAELKNRRQEIMQERKGLKKKKHR